MLVLSRVNIEVQLFAVKKQYTDLSARSVGGRVPHSAHLGEFNPTRSSNAPRGFRNISIVHRCNASLILLSFRDVLQLQAE